MKYIFVDRINKDFVHSNDILRKTRGEHVDSDGYGFVVKPFCIELPYVGKRLCKEVI